MVIISQMSRFRVTNTLCGITGITTGNNLKKTSMKMRESDMEVQHLVLLEWVWNIIKLSLVCLIIQQI